MKDYYAVLGVKTTDDSDTIKAAYRVLAKQNHPDLHPDDVKAKARFQEISEAWETLGDPEKREKYDIARTDAAPKKKSAAADKKAYAPSGGSVSYQDIMNQFGSFFSDEKIKKKPTDKKSRIDTTDMFEQFMNIKKKP